MILKPSSRGFLYTSLVVAGVALVCWWRPSTGAATEPSESPECSESSVLSAGSANSEGSYGVDLASLVASDPLGFLDVARSHYRQEIRDYTCRFARQELLPRGLGDNIEFRVRYREEPRCVLMEVIDPPQKIRRVLWVRGAHTDRTGREHMLVEPTGLLGVIFPQAEIPIDDERIMRDSRSTIDDFGFRATLEWFQEVNLKALQDGVLDLRFVGEGKSDAGPTYILERRLPYTGPEGTYPDALAILHMDQQRLVPVLLECFADIRQQTLLARYRISEIRLNVGLDDQDFRL